MNPAVLIEKGGQDLRAHYRASRTPAPQFRADEVKRAVTAIEHRRSVLLVGPPGVGKTTIVRMMVDKLHAAYAFSTTAILSNTKYLGEWETKIAEILACARETGAVLYIPDVWNLPHAGKTSNSERQLLDAMRGDVESGAVRLIAECTPDTVRMLERLPKFVDLFERINVAPLTAEQVRPILDISAAYYGLPVDAALRSTMIKLTSRFLPARPQPGSALKLLEQVVRDVSDHGGAVDVRRLERVFCAYTGLPSFVVSPTETRRIEEIRQFFRERVIGQPEALEAVAETIALFKAGLNDPERPIGTFLFVGPTGVGKTEMARVLATFLFGSAHRLLRFDLSEFKDYHSFQQLIGDPRSPDSAARLIDPVRAQPFQVVLLDEIEKAHPNVWDLLLPLLDEGRMTPPNGEPVDFRRTIVIATSNVGADAADKSVGFGASADDARTRRFRQALEQHFRPELLNRFQHLVVFHALDADQVQAIARQELTRILQREGITTRNLAVDVDDAVLAKIVEHGYDKRWGARGLKRELQQRIVLPLALTLMETGVHDGQLLKVRLDGGRIRIGVIDTEPVATARAVARAERRPIKAANRVMDVNSWLAFAAELRERVEAVAAEARELDHREKIEAIEKQRERPDFWQRPDAAARALRDLDHHAERIRRLNQLRERLTTLLSGERSRASVEQLAERLTDLEEDIAETRRELVCFGADGHWDALVEVSPLAGQTHARDWIIERWAAWAEHHGHELDWLRDPIGDESAFFAIKGAWTFGWVRREAGLHRVRAGETTTAARVRVAPWSDRPAAPEEVDDHRALRRDGTFSGRLRSRLAMGPVVLQNGRTLQENRELALQLLGPWREAPPPSDEVIRRYDVDPPMIRDHRTGWQSQRPDAHSPERWAELLITVVEAE
jgi:ATP-dependent Clp protease ATP-binding subunit ClpC